MNTPTALMLLTIWCLGLTLWLAFITRMLVVIDRRIDDLWTYIDTHT